MALCFMFLLFLLPSQVLMSYKTYDLYQLCHIEDSIVDSVDDHDKKTKSIDIYERPAVHLEHVWDNSSFKHFHHCEFNVNVLPARKSAFSAISGLFVAIRKLNFRQNADGECIDYITFELHARDKITTRKICGLVSDDEEAILDTKNYLEIPDGFLKIVIHIDHHNLEPNEIVMKLTFTVFQDCKGSYKFQCSEGRCISLSLFDDSIINCIPPSCGDEPKLLSKCGTELTYHPSHMSYVLVISVSLFAVIVVVAVAWYCFRLYVRYNGYFGGHAAAPNIPVVEYRAAYVPPATDDTLGATQAQPTTENPPSYDSVISDNRT